MQVRKPTFCIKFSECPTVPVPVPYCACARSPCLVPSILLSPFSEYVARNPNVSPVRGFRALVWHRYQNAASLTKTKLLRLV